MASTRISFAGFLSESAMSIKTSHPCAHVHYSHVFRDHMIPLNVARDRRTEAVISEKHISTPEHYSCFAAVLGNSIN